MDVNDRLQDSESRSSYHRTLDWSSLHSWNLFTSSHSIGRARSRLSSFEIPPSHPCSRSLRNRSDEEMHNPTSLSARGRVHLRKEGDQSHRDEGLPRHGNSLGSNEQLRIISCNHELVAQGRISHNWAHGDESENSRVNRGNEVGTTVRSGNSPGNHFDQPSSAVAHRQREYQQYRHQGHHHRRHQQHQHLQRHQHLHRYRRHLQQHQHQHQQRQQHQQHHSNDHFHLHHHYHHVHRHSSRLLDNENQDQGTSSSVSARPDASSITLTQRSGDAHRSSVNRRSSVMGRESSGSNERDIATEARNRLDERFRSAALISQRHRNLSFLEEFSLLFSGEDDEEFWDDDEMQEVGIVAYTEGWYRSELSSSTQGSLSSKGLSKSAIRKLHREVYLPKMLRKDKGAEDGSLEHNDCAVCLERFRSGQVLVHLPCHHRFHTDCLSPWLESHGQCPCCRAEIEEENKGGG